MAKGYQQIDEPERRTRRNVKLVMIISVVAFIVGVSIAISELRSSRAESVKSIAGINNDEQTIGGNDEPTVGGPPVSPPNDEPSLVGTEDAEENQNRGTEIPTATNTETSAEDDDLVQDIVTETGRIDVLPAVDYDSGFASAIAATRNRVVVGANNIVVNGIQIGSVFVYEKESTFGPWNLTQQIFDSTATSSADRGLQFGTAVALSYNTIVVGAPGGDVEASNSGSVYIFSLHDGVWHPIQRLTAPDAKRNDSFGATVAADEDVILVGAPGANQVYLFEQNKTSELFTMRDALQPRSGSGNRFGSSMALKDGMLVVGAPGDEDASDESEAESGAVYVYRKRPNNAFARKDIIKANDEIKGDSFGASVATDGNAIVVGAPNTNSAHVFEEVSYNRWVEAARLGTPRPTVNKFGSAVAIEGDLIAVAASDYKDESNNLSSSGTAHVFVRGCVTVNGTDWVLRNQLLPKGTTNTDQSFGSAMQIVDGVVVVGSSKAGAVHFFNIPIALGPTCAPIGQPSIAPTNWWMNLQKPTLRTTSQPSITSGDT